MPWTSMDIVKIVGVPYETLNYWIRVEYVAPSIRSQQGSGSRRLWSLADLVTIQAILELSAAGVRVPAKLLRQAALLLRAANPETEMRRLVVAPPRPFWLSAASPAGQMFETNVVSAINYPAVAAALRRKLPTGEAHAYSQAIP